MAPNPNPPIVPLANPVERISPVPQNERGKVYLDSENFVSTVDPQTQEVFLLLTGNLPNPCYKLDYEVKVLNQTYEINVFSYMPEEMKTVMCVQSLEPFELRIPLAEATYPLQIHS